MLSKLTLILVIICMGLAIGLSLSISTCNKKSKQVKTIKEISYSIIHDTVEYKTDKFGTVHAQKKVISGNKKTLDVFYKPKFDSLCDAYNIQSKQLDQFISIYLQDTGSFITKLFEVDDFSKSFTFTDSFLKEECIITDSNAVCHYTVSVPLDIGIFWKRKHKIWFIKFGKKIYRTDVSSKNKNITVKDLLSIKITKDL